MVTYNLLELFPSPQLKHQLCKVKVVYYYWKFRRDWMSFLEVMREEVPDKSLVSLVTTH